MAEMYLVFILENIPSIVYLLHDKRLKDFRYLKGNSYLFYVSLSALEKSYFLLELQSNFFPLGGRVTGSLWRGLFVREFGE